MLLIQALVLGLVQGLATFLPISASGHRDGVRYLAAWEPGSPGFDAMLYLGTLVAVVAYFRSDLWYLATRTVGAGDDTERRHARRSLGLLALASVPAAVVGWWLQPSLPVDLAHERVVAVLLYVTAALLVGAEWLRRRRLAAERGTSPGELSPQDRRLDIGRHEGTTTVGDATSIGLVQALAVLPGLSRTAATIAAGMAVGMSRAAAARLSLLLSIPVLAGALVVALGDARADAAEVGATPFGGVDMVAAALVAAVSGYTAIRLLLRMAEREDLLGFARWVALFATLVLFASFFVIG